MVVTKVGNWVAAFGIQIKNGIATIKPYSGAGKKCFQSMETLFLVVGS